MLKSLAQQYFKITDVYSFVLLKIHLVRLNPILMNNKIQPVKLRKNLRMYHLPLHLFGTKRSDYNTITGDDVTRLLYYFKDNYDMLSFMD